MIILTMILMIVIAAARMTRLCTLNIVSGFCAAAQRFRFPWTRGMLTIHILFSELQIIMSRNCFPLSMSRDGNRGGGQIYRLYQNFGQLLLWQSCLCFWMKRKWIEMPHWCIEVWYKTNKSTVKRRKHILQGKNDHLLVVTGRVWEVWPSSPQFTRPGPPVPAEGQTRMDFHSAILLLIFSSTSCFQHPYDWWAFWVLCCQAPQPICWWLGDLARSMGPSVLLLVGLMGLVKLVVTVGVVVLVSILRIF